MSFVTNKIATRRLGVSRPTLCAWSKNGTIQCIRSPTGQRLYNIDDFLRSNGGASSSKEDANVKEKICYCRVSSHNQKDDLQRQVKSMSEQFPNHKIVTDIGSGINFKRKGLLAILERSCKGQVSEVVVAYRDRLCRFAFELLERVFQINGVKLLVLHEGVEGGHSEGELVEDLLAVVNVFNCRVNGRRKYKKSTKKESDVV